MSYTPEEIVEYMSQFMPEGYEFTRYGLPRKGDCILEKESHVSKDSSDYRYENSVILKNKLSIKWPSFLIGGYIAKDESGSKYWYPLEPVLDHKGRWIPDGKSGFCISLRGIPFPELDNIHHSESLIKYSPDFETQDLPDA